MLHVRYIKENADEYQKRYVQDVEGNAEVQHAASCRICCRENPKMQQKLHVRYVAGNADLQLKVMSDMLQEMLTCN
jgi:hypothetical protein